MAARGRYAHDRGLTVRMAVAMTVLGLEFALFALIVLAVLAAIIIFIGVMNTTGWPIGLRMFFAVLFACWALGFLLMLVCGLIFDDFALPSLDAKYVTPEQEPELHGTIERLCVLADTTKPQVAVADTRLPNAYAIGASRRKIVLCVTTGLLHSLDGDELEAVIAHEMSHAAHRDAQVMTLASMPASIAGFTGAGIIFGGLTIVLFGWLLPVCALVCAINFPPSRLLSRYRELAADRGAALLTGKPAALQSALIKVNDGMSRTPAADLREAESVNTFLFVPVEKEFRPILARMFDTHPPLERRLAELDKVREQLSQAG
jgi:heat shock protein HtpX